VNNLKKTVRLKKEESLLLQEKAFALTKKAIYQGNKVVFQESDIVHFILDELLDKVDINKDGSLIVEK